MKGPLPPASNPSLDVPPGVGTTDLVGDTNGVPFADPLGMGTFEIKAPPPARIEKHEPSGPVRLGSVLVNGNLLYKVQPLYPALARSNHIQGVVEFTAIISREGTIQNLQLKRGHPLLVNAARDAVLQWRYRPTILNGQAVEVITDIIVNFNLNQ